MTIIFTLYIFLTLFGAGLITEKIVGYKNDNVWEVYLFGYMTLFITCACLHLFFPLVPLLSTLLTLPAATYAAISLIRRENPVRLIQSTSHKLEFATYSVLIFLLFYIAPMDSDTGLYHQQVLFWIRNESVPIGVSNFYGRLGFQSGLHYVLSVFNFPGLDWKMPLCFNLTSFLVFTLSLLPKFKRSVRAIVLLSLFPIALYQIRSINTDLMAALLTFTTLYYCFEKSPKSVLLSSLAFSLKASQGYLFVFAFLYSKLRRINISFKNYLFSGVTIFLTLLYSILHSGYLVYPFTWTRLSFLPWASGLEQASFDVFLIKNWPKGLDPDNPLVGPKNWITDLLLEKLYGEPIVLVLLLISIVFVFYNLAKKNYFKSAVALAVLFLITNVPEYRFHAGAMAYFCMDMLGTARAKKLIIFFLMALNLHLVYHHGDLNLRNFSSWESYPTVELTRFQETPISLYHPRKNTQCWNLNVACTAFPDYQQDVKRLSSGHLYFRPSKRDFKREDKIIPQGYDPELLLD